MLAGTRAVVVVLAGLAASDAAAAARHRPKVGVDLGLLVAAGNTAAIAGPLEARVAPVLAELEAFVAAHAEADAVPLNFVDMLADELVELLEVAKHELDLCKRPLHLIVLVEILTQVLLHAEAAIAPAPVDFASALAAVGFLLLNALLAVAAEHGVRCEVRRRTHLALVIVLTTVAKEILVLSPPSVHVFVNHLRNPRTLRRVPLVKRCLVFLLRVLGILQCHPDGVVCAIHSVIAEDRAEGFFQVIERELRRLVRRGRLHERRAIVECGHHLFLLASDPQLILWGFLDPFSCMLHGTPSVRHPSWWYPRRIPDEPLYADHTLPPAECRSRG